MKKTYSIFISGVVQGVGFRPFIYNTAKKFNVHGFVKNTLSGVEINITCDANTLDNFINHIKTYAPPLSHILSLTYNEIMYEEFKDFSIEASLSGSGITLISPDIAICDDCVNELFDEKDRRYLYPFINCTNCGPRYSIIFGLPYDRDKTTMREFEMCNDCYKEYTNPSDRRFHAQPIGCHNCGPSVFMDHLTGLDAIKQAAKLINDGEIVVLKGLGGYHITCDATNDNTVSKLRALKKRKIKPFAIMCKDLNTLKKYITLDEDYCHLLKSVSAPIVIMNKKIDVLSKHINPLDNTVGIMLAYTPLHMILLNYTKTDFIVATSGNIKDEPIVKDAEEAEKKLSVYTKHFLHHNRKIYMRIDDSVATIINKKIYILRRARGFAPYPIFLPRQSKEVAIGLGAHLKNTICLAIENYAFVSQYIGDLDNIDTIDFFEEVLEHFTNIFNAKPFIYLTDLHPNYYTSKWVINKGVNAVRIQHHLAHMAACMAENNLIDNVIGVIFDGTGLGFDMKIWGGEFFIKKQDFTRAFHLEYYKQPGGDASSINPYRMLISYCYKNNFLEKGVFLFEKRLGITNKELDLIISILESDVNAPETSSMGRLFEAIGSLLICTRKNEFEGHLAMSAESLCNSSIKDFYPYKIENEHIKIGDLLLAIIEDIFKTTDTARIATRFHNTIAHLILDVCKRLYQKYEINDVVLSGGVFQNRFLLTKTIALLHDNSFHVYCHSRVPANDGCISLGQVYFNLLNNVFVK